MSILNFNLGVLGHVDSGKTSLSKALSTVASTACFDKNPQSKERGITLDLGFSSFTVESPESIKTKGFDQIQYTLVDCPGHASLIRTIIGGAQIIDMMVLVIDIVKGIQTQTAECLIIGEITCDKLMIVLNKLDLIEEAKRESTIDKMTKRLYKVLETTKFANCPVIAVAANPALQDGKETCQQNTIFGVDALINKLKELTFVPNRNPDGPFLFAIDHCFTIKGQGTVMTGTVLNGSVKVNDTIELPALKQQKKVKSMQIFRKPVNQAIQGDRVGICVTNFDSKLIERGIACTPDYIRDVYGVIINLSKIKHYKHNIEAGSRFHISMGHETVIGKIELFGEIDGNIISSNTAFDFSKEYAFLKNYEVEDENNASDESAKLKVKNYYALIDFTETHHEHVLCTPNSLIIGSKLDTDIHLNQCRIAFSGRVIHAFVNKDYRTNGDLAYVKIFKEKSKEGVVERMNDPYVVIGKNLFKKETNMDLFNGMKVTLSTGEKGVIDGNFGQSGKFKVRIQSGLSQEAQEILTDMKGKKKNQQEHQPQTQQQPIKIFLKFKKYVYDDKKKMIQ